jgi:hypothetical protein
MTLIRILRSTTLLLLIFLAAANLLFARMDASTLIPMTHMNPQEAAQRALAFKMHALENGPNPDVLLLGSSLPMAAAYYADAKHHKQELDRFIDSSVEEKVNPFQAYPRADRLSAILSEPGQRPLNVVNLTAPACMISDGFLLLSEALSRKQVKTVIWGIAPRDFVDNVIPPIGKTPAFSAVGSAKHLPNVLAAETEPLANADLVLSATLHFYRQRTAMRHAFDLCLSSLFDQPISLTDSGMQKPKPTKVVSAVATSLPAASTSTAAAGMAKASDAHAVAADAPFVSPEKRASQIRQVALLPECSQKNSLGALAVDEHANEPGWNQSLVAQYVDYWHRYNPPNYQRLDAQLAQLKRALKLCKDAGVNVVLVDMPLPRRHQALIDPALFSKYRAAISSAAADAGATVLNLNKPDGYNSEDWIDSLHVTAYGADKFFAALQQEIGRPSLSNRGRVAAGM